MNAGLSWNWIALAAVAPPIAGLLAALPFWLRKEPIFGNLTGTVLIFGAAFGFIMREKLALDRVMEGCLERGYYCFPEPSAFTRYAIYAFIALFEVMMLFLVSLRVEQRIRRRGYAPEWR